MSDLMLVYMQNLFKKKINKHTALLQAAEYRHFMSLRLANMFIVTFFIILVFGGGFFIYQRIYTTIGQVQAITILRSQLGAEVINFKNLEEIEEAWQKKKTSVVSINRDPFNFVIVPTEKTELEEE